MDDPIPLRGRTAIPLREVAGARVPLLGTRRPARQHDRQPDRGVFDVAASHDAEPTSRSAGSSPGSGRGWWPWPRTRAASREPRARPAAARPAPGGRAHRRPPAHATRPTQGSVKRRQAPSAGSPSASATAAAPARRLSRALVRGRHERDRHPPRRLVAGSRRRHAAPRRPARALGGGRGEDVVVVFERKPSPPIRSTVIEVAHAPRPRRDAADDEIVRRLRPRPTRPVRVVTSDRWLADRAGALGAGVARRRDVPGAAGRILRGWRQSAGMARPSRAAAATARRATRPRRPRRRAGPGWRVTPAPDGRGGRRADSSPGPTALALVVALLRPRAARAQPLDLLPGAAAQRARTDPLQPDLPRSGPGRQRQRDLLDRRLHPGTSGTAINYPPNDQQRRPTTNFSPRSPRSPTTRSSRSCS